MGLQSRVSYSGFVMGLRGGGVVYMVSLYGGFHRVSSKWVFIVM